jgi:hypothetical protein
MRSRPLELRVRWCVLLSALLHILAMLALNILLTPADGPHPPGEPPAIRVFLAQTNQADESLLAMASPEIANPGETSDGSKTYAVRASESSFAPKESVSSNPRPSTWAKHPSPLTRVPRRLSSRNLFLPAPLVVLPMPNVVAIPLLNKAPRVILRRTHSLRSSLRLSNPHG